MTTRRVPLPWEPQGEPAPVGSLDMARVVVVPDAFGELPGRDPRDVRAQMAHELTVNVTDGSAAGREWAAAKAETALRRWDQGVSSGQIKI